MANAYRNVAKPSTSKHTHIHTFRLKISCFECLDCADCFRLMWSSEEFQFISFRGHFFVVLYSYVLLLLLLAGRSEERNCVGAWLNGLIYWTLYHDLFLFLLLSNNLFVENSAHHVHVWMDVHIMCVSFCLLFIASELRSLFQFQCSASKSNSLTVDSHWFAARTNPHDVCCGSLVETNFCYDIRLFYFVFVLLLSLL